MNVIHLARLTTPGKTAKSLLARLARNDFFTIYFINVNNAIKYFGKVNCIITSNYRQM